MLFLKNRMWNELYGQICSIHKIVGEKYMDDILQMRFQSVQSMNATGNSVNHGNWWCGSHDKASRMNIYVQISLMLHTFILYTLFSFNIHKSCLSSNVVPT